MFSGFVGIILIFFIPYTASGFKAVGTLFNSLFGFDYHVSMIAGAAIIIGYTVLGGFLAVSTTDLIQSVVMSIALIIIVFFGIHVAGGWDAVISNAQSLAGYFSMTSMHNMADHTSSPYSLLTICSTLAWGLGYFGMPHILLRFMAIEDENKLTLSRRIASVWVVISMFVAILIGIIGYSASVAGSVPMLSTSSQSEDHYHSVVRTFRTEWFPAFRHRWNRPGRHFGFHHVHGRFPAAYSGFRHLPEPASGLLKD